MRCQISWSNYGPVIVSEYAKTAFGSHPRRVLSVTTELVAVTAEAAGSSPVVPAIFFSNLPAVPHFRGRVADQPDEPSAWSGASVIVVPILGHAGIRTSFANGPSWLTGFPPPRRPLGTTLLEAWPTLISRDMIHYCLRLQSHIRISRPLHILRCGPHGKELTALSNEKALPPLQKMTLWSTWIVEAVALLGPLWSPIVHLLPNRAEHSDFLFYTLAPFAVLWWRAYVTAVKILPVLLGVFICAVLLCHDVRGYGRFWW